MMFPLVTVRFALIRGMRILRVLRLTTFKTSGVARLAPESPARDNVVDTRLPDPVYRSERAT